MAAIVTALHRLIQTVKIEDEPMQSYIARIQSNMRLLVDSDVTMADLPVAFLLSNIGEEFSATISALDTLDSVSMEKASSLLLMRNYPGVHQLYKRRTSRRLLLSRQQCSACSNARYRFPANLALSTVPKAHTPIHSSSRRN
uniref:Uncharacterized protein n=1 Tax=Spongospora subterranea TaxID=70186 RepID=A0A0H5RHQ1_9EUKA|eukprot:CRZ08199.1 hypothetical protein [Spongospora subterranea]